MAEIHAKSNSINIESNESNQSFSNQKSARLQNIILTIIWIVVVFSLGLGSGYLLWGTEIQQWVKIQVGTDLMSQVNPPEGYQLSVIYGDLGPSMLAAQAIDFDKFVQVYDRAGRPLNDTQKAILSQGSDDLIAFNNDNAYFLLNYFWALGLANANPILIEGPMMQYGSDQVGRFASTGGWTIGAKPATELYASVALLTLTSQQQARLEYVAQNVYRPCCNNPTHFPDCNHGMAMLGMLTLLASEGVSEAEMFEAAKYANAFWYPQQTYGLALYFDATEGLTFIDVDATQLVSQEFSSGAGFGQVHEYLASNGLLEQAPNNGNSCGV